MTEFNYDLQVWTRNGVIQPCGHPEIMRSNNHCCDADRYKGKTIEEAKASKFIGKHFVFTAVRS